MPSELGILGKFCRKISPTLTDIGFYLPARFLFCQLFAEMGKLNQGDQECGQSDRLVNSVVRMKEIRDARSLPRSKDGQSRSEPKKKPQVG